MASDLDVQMQKQSTLQGLVFGLVSVAIFTLFTRNCSERRNTRLDLCNAVQQSPTVSATTKTEMANFCAYYTGTP